MRERRDLLVIIVFVAIVAVLFTAYFVDYTPATLSYISGNP